MSNHHQTAGKPAKSDRRVEHHRERQATRAALQVGDLEEVLDPPSVHNAGGTLAANAAPDTSRRRLRHWKQPFWKRRTELRRRRNEASRRGTDKQP